MRSDIAVSLIDFRAALEPIPEVPRHCYIQLKVSFTKLLIGVNLHNNLDIHIGAGFILDNGDSPPIADLGLMKTWKQVIPVRENCR